MESLYSRKYLGSLDRIALLQLCKRHNIAPNGANTKLRKILRQVNASPFRHNAAKRTASTPPVRKYRKTFSLSSALSSENGARAATVVVEQRFYNITNSVDNSVSTFKVITLQHPISRPRNAAISRAERRAQTSPTSAAKRPKLHIMEHWEGGLSPRSTRCQALYGLMDAAVKLQAGRVRAQRAESPSRDDPSLLLVADTPSTAIPEPPVLVPSQAAPLRVLELPEEPRPRVFKTYDIPVLQTSSSLAVAARKLLKQDIDEGDAMGEPSSSTGPRAGSSRASGPEVNSRRSKLSKVDLAGEDMDEDDGRPLQMEDLDDVELDLLETLEDFVPRSRCTTPEPPESGPESQPATLSSSTVGDVPSYSPRRAQRRRPSPRLSLLFTALFASNRQKAQLADLQAKQLEQAAMTTDDSPSNDDYDDYSARADEENLWMNTEPLAYEREHENEREVSRLPSSSYPDALGAHSHSQHALGGGEEDMDIDSDESVTSFSIYCDAEPEGVLVGYTQHQTSFCRGKENTVTMMTGFDTDSSSGESSTSDGHSTCVEDAAESPLFDHLLGTLATHTAFEPRHRKYSVCLEDFRYVASAGGVEYVRCRVKDDDGWEAFTNLALAQGFGLAATGLER